MDGPLAKTLICLAILTVSGVCALLLTGWTIVAALQDWPPSLRLVICCAASWAAAAMSFWKMP